MGNWGSKWKLEQGKDEETYDKICWASPSRKETKRKKSLTFYITATLSNMIDSVHFSSVEGHPTQAVISDQA